LKTARNVYVIGPHFAKHCKMALLVTGILAGSLFIEALARWYYTGTGTEQRSAGYVFVTPMCYFITAVGVIWLGWYGVRLVSGIKSLAQLLKTNKLPNIKPSGNAIINQLGEAINERFGDSSSCAAELEKQIRDLQIQIQVSQKREKNTEAIIYSIRDAVIVIDEFDKLLMANEAAGKLFNFDVKSSQRKPVGELIDAGGNKFVDFLRQSRQGKVQHKRLEIDFSIDDGLKTFDCIVSCVYDENEQVCGVVAVLHDITREKEISKMKNDFVSHVSHELKTPLASINAYSEMLLEGEAKDGQTRKEFYSVIQGQAKRLNRLIEDILNISRIESGLIQVKKKPISLTILIEEQLQMIRGQAQEKSIEITSQKPIVFDQVYVDSDMISRVIVNLLSNAIKYTPSGGSIKIETEVDEIARLARVSVTDTGVGIPENELEHVFDKFYRVSANEAQAKGTGLGLNLVKQIVEKVHNGRLFVTSQVGVGSTFGFELPLATAEVVETV
jgi:PAS domain S-box-containing protein